MDCPRRLASGSAVPRGPRSRAIRAIGVSLLALVLVSLTTPSATASSPSKRPGYSSETVHVKFREGTYADLPRVLLTPSLDRASASITKLLNLPNQKLDELRARGMTRSGKFLPDLNLWFEIRLQPGVDVAAFLEELKRLPSVESAEPTPLPQAPPAITPDFTGNQAYLDAAPGGIDARFSFTIPGGNGSGITIYDVEYDWNQMHEDLSKAHGLPLLLDSGDINAPFEPDPFDPFRNRNHGTAVLGVIVGDNDTKGVTGISWGAAIGLAPAQTQNKGYNPANAIMLAAANGSAGDVILVEQSIAVCNLGPTDTGPIEWYDPWFAVIETAVANGFVVVETAGNGNVNLDQASCEGKFERTVRDSGAIIVGAGGSPSSGLDRERKADSTYGRRVDLQAWGDSVATTGWIGDLYMNPDDPTNPDFWYTGTFAGTSSAGAIVAGAVANLQGIAVALLGTPLTSSQLRTLLVETGSPQLGNTAEHIGPRPDLRQAIAQLIPPTANLTVTSPNGGEIWPIGSTQVIQWTSSGLTGKVKIQVSRNGGASWSLITASTANDGRFNWTVTGKATTHARIRITSVTDPTVLDVSDADFTIVRE